MKQELCALRENFVSPFVFTIEHFRICDADSLSAT
jgi:hypothetical protein